MDSQTVFAKLRDVLAHLYPTTESARRIADDAGLDARRIRFSSQALENWHAILAEAVQAGKVDALLHIVLAEYDSNGDLLAAYGMYRHFIEQVGPLEAPEEPVISSTIHGDVVHGDKTTVGDIHQSEAVAIGSGAFAQNVKNFFFGEHEDVIRQRNRRAMLQLVKATWIEGVLEQSLYNAVLIDLHLETRPRAVDYPWNMIIRTPDQVDRPFPHGTKIVDVFEQMQQSMLILGEPGSGKTTMLLALGRDLIARAEDDPTLPLPVVFNLSSWAEKRKSLEAWLLDEFNTKYRIPKKVAQSWIDHDELLLLLDGLDEVAADQRDACATAINNFRQEHLVGLAICCRSEEHQALATQLKLVAAVSLLPLTREQVDGYLVGAGKKLAAVRVVLRDDVVLQEMVESPLMLNVMALAYQDKAVGEVRISRSLEARRGHLFDAYIDRMFVRLGRSRGRVYSRERAVSWLSWLASHMAEYSQTVFLIEQLQPSWLHPRNSKPSFNLLLALWGPIYGLLCGSLLILIFNLVETPLLLLMRERGNELWDILELIFSPLRMMILLLWAISLGVLIAVVDTIGGGLAQIRVATPTDSLFFRLRSSLYATGFWGVNVLLVSGLTSMLTGSLAEALRSGLQQILMIAPISGLISIYIPMRPVGWMNKTWKQVKNRLLMGAKFGLLVAIATGLIGSPELLSEVWIPGNQLPVHPILLLFYVVIQILRGLFYGAVFGLFSEPDTRPEVLPTTVTQTPNQGIRLSAQRSALTGILFGLTSAFLGTFFVITSLPIGNLMVGEIFGILSGLIFGVTAGGEAFIKHLLLRFELYRKECAPLNYARFLDYCADRIFLRKVGGSYIFVHRLLMEHFASLTEEDIKRLASSK